MPSRPAVAITMGDPGGIGPEIILKALANEKNTKGACPVIIGTASAFERLNAGFEAAAITEDSFRITDPDGLHFLDVTREADRLLEERGFASNAGRPFETGKISAVNAALSLAAVQTAARLAMAGKVKAIVTAPVNKTSIRLIDSHFSGHTELLAEAAGNPPYAMMFVGPRFHVTLATVHVALRDVSSCLSEKLILEKILLTDDFLRRLLGVPEPAIAVCALNPHGEETGTEETDIIRPAVETASARGINVKGPFSADQLFYEAYNGRYHALIAMYHDQGLGPFKMTAFHDGVNVTLGLPFIRTSPDHGTAFDIAYQDKADASSMETSLRLAVRLAGKKKKQR